MICDNCLHADVCGEEGAFEPALTYCADYLGWISTNKGLPEIDAEENKKHYYDSGYKITSKPVLVTVEGKYGRYVTIGRYGKEPDGESKWLTANGKGRVVAWMPKPEPYCEK